MKPNEQPRLLQQVVPADNRGSESLAEVEQRAVPAEVAPSWQDCERKFAEMARCFGRDMVKYRKLAAEYDAMLAAYERTQEDGDTGGNAKAEPPKVGSSD